MRPVKRRRIVTERNAHVFHPGVLKASRKLLDPEVHLGVGLLTGLARMAEAQTARDGSVLDHMPPLKWLSGKLKVQMLIVHGTSSCLVWAPDGLGFVFTIGISSRTRGVKVGFRNAGAKAGAPCSLEMRQGFPDLQGISFAASAECGRTECPWRAGRLHESCGC